jgi:hypothetical protein
MKKELGLSASRFVRLAVVFAAAALSSCGGGGSNDIAPPEHTVAVVMAGNGTGTVVDDLGGIQCPGNCGPNTYTPNEHVLLTATPDQGSSFGGWSGDCTPTVGHPLWCEMLVTGHMVVTATFNSP